jgi:putative colanic acid biosynthesis UDP-glucose lipid carrier transferase
MQKHRYSFLFKYIAASLDILIFCIAYIIALYHKFSDLKTGVTVQYFNFFLFSLLIWISLFYFTGLLRKRSRLNFNIPHLLFDYSGMVLIHLCLMGLFLFLTKNYSISREVVLVRTGFTFLLGFGWRIIGIYILQVYRVKGNNLRYYAIIGESEMAQFIQRYYKDHPELGYRLLGVFQTNNLQQSPEIQSLFRSMKLDYVYYCQSNLKSEIVEELYTSQEKFGFELKVLRDFSGFWPKALSLQYQDYLPILSLSKKPFTDEKVELTKRSFDIVFATCVIVLGSPVFLTLILLTKFTSKGSIFYKQERIGRWGRPFQIVKFRSMFQDAENGNPQLSQGETDNRITSWGRFMRKTRLDELPQFFNVLKGDMSMVGPRPERQFFIDQIVEKSPEYMRLLSLKPGITSLGQIYYGYASNVDEMRVRLRYDLLYLRKFSFELDLYLIYATALVMIKGRGQ